MMIKALYPTIVTERLTETRDFYLKLGFELVYEIDWYVHLRAPGGKGFEFGFVRPGLDNQESVFRTAFDGRGLGYGLEVDDAAAEYDRIAALGVPFAFGPRDEPWGQRHFGVLDPNGVVLDFVQHIPAPPEYAAGYAQPAAV